MATISRMIFYIFLISVLNWNFFASGENEVDWTVEFDQIHIIYMGRSKNFNFTINNLNKTELIESVAMVQLVSSNPEIVHVSKIVPLEELNEDSWRGTSTVQSISLGSANISVQITRHSEIVVSLEKMTIIVDRKPIFNPTSRYYLHINRIFDISLSFIFGTALNVKNLKNVIQNPFGAVCAFLLNFILLPLVRNILVFFNDRFK